MREESQVGIGRSKHGEGEVIRQNVRRAHEGVKGDNLREKGARKEGFENGIPEKNVFGRKGVEDGGRGSWVVESVIERDELRSDEGVGGVAGGDCDGVKLKEGIEGCDALRERDEFDMINFQ